MYCRPLLCCFQKISLIPAQHSWLVSEAPTVAVSWMYWSLCFYNTASIMSLSVGASDVAKSSSASMKFGTPATCSKDFSYCFSHSENHHWLWLTSQVTCSEQVITRPNPKAKGAGQKWPALYLKNFNNWNISITKRALFSGKPILLVISTKHSRYTRETVCICLGK